MSNNNLIFNGRVAIVTGAGTGLGRAYSFELAKRGARVVVNDLGCARDGIGEDSPAADRVAYEIRKMGGEAVANYDSVATPESGENLVKAAVDAFGKVDILINNAGILRDKSFIKLGPEDWDAVTAVHLKGAYCVTRPAFKIMRENNFGRIVMTTSAAALYGNFGQSNYAAAKLGLVGLMNVLRIEGGKYNVKVNTVAPVAATRLTEEVTPEDFLKKMNLESVVPMVICLCSDQCSETGNIYNAGMGVFSRAALITGPAVSVDKGENVPSAEDVMANLDRINSLEGGKFYSNIADQMVDA